MPLQENWVVKGSPIRDAGLRERLADVLARAAALIPEIDPAELADQRDIDGALTRLDALSDLVRGLPEDSPGRADVMADLRDVHGDLREHRAVMRYDAMSGIRSALAELRATQSVDDLLERTPAVLCQKLGFDRAFISRVEDSLWVPIKVHVEGDPDWAAEIMESGRAGQPLDHMLLESEMARRRAPMLVAEVQGSPYVHQPIAASSDSRSYVAAPIMPEGHVIGFLHADHYVSQRHVDEFDREVLWAFAEAYGYLFMKVILNGRLRAQAEQVRAMTASLEVVIDEIRDTEVRIADESHTSPGAARKAPPSPGNDRLRSLLTARELEVLALMAAGETNASIGARLVISEGTVKSHVKHILRKLHAANRAEAVSKYLRLAARDGHDALMAV